MYLRGPRGSSGDVPLVLECARYWLVAANVHARKSLCRSLRIAISRLDDRQICCWNVKHLWNLENNVQSNVLDEVLQSR